MSSISDAARAAFEPVRAREQEHTLCNVTAPKVGPEAGARFSRRR